jgi:hypothetical protein
MQQEGEHDSRHQHQGSDHHHTINHQQPNGLKVNYKTNYFMVIISIA